MKSTSVLRKTMLHGADYNYEQWLENPDIIRDDIAFMKQARCNVMTVGVFSWSMIEPEEGHFRFDWLDDLFETLSSNGLSLILGTPSGAKPAWLSGRYPEVCRVSRDGRREAHRFRHNHCRTSPVYRQKCVEINTRLAERYKDHPALLMWHVSNEYNAGACYCDACLDAFRDWLKNRYTTLDALNKAWWTTFWSHTYTDWEQIEPYDSSIHGLMLDWQRFLSDQTLDFFLEESKPLRKISPHVPITTNFMMPDVGLDYWQFTEYVDVISWDSYPNWHIGEEEWKEGVKTAFFHDLHRSYKDAPFMLMESTPSVTNWQGISIPKKPNMHLLSSLQAIAHGSNTVQYFQWRQSRGGVEKFHSAVISHSGRTDTKIFEEVSAVGDALSKISDIKNSLGKSRIVVLYDFQNEWALSNAQLSRNVEKKYQERCIIHYGTFWQMGIPVDIKDSTVCDFSNYDLVIAPMLYMVRDGVAERLKNFVRNGGVFVATYMTGLVNESDLCFFGGNPGPLRELMGIRVEDTDILDNNHNQGVIYNGSKYQVCHYADFIHQEGAEVCAVYTHDYLKQRPAVTVNSYGSGRAYYIASRNEDRFYTDFYRSLIAELSTQQIRPLNLPAGVTVQYRYSEEFVYLFVMNFNAESCSLEITGSKFLDMLTDSRIDGEINLPAYGIRVLKQELNSFSKAFRINST